MQFLLQTFYSNVVGFYGYFSIGMDPHGLSCFDGNFLHYVMSYAFDPEVVTDKGHGESDEHSCRWHISGIDKVKFTVGQIGFWSKIETATFVVMDHCSYKYEAL